jgi:hypothetical protein
MSVDVTEAGTPDIKGVNSHPKQSLAGVIKMAVAASNFCHKPPTSDALRDLAPPMFDGKFGAHDSEPLP